MRSQQTGKLKLDVYSNLYMCYEFYKDRIENQVKKEVQMLIGMGASFTFGTILNRTGG